MTDDERQQAISDGLAAVMQVILKAEANLGPERELAKKDPNRSLRAYREGMCDGVEETLKALIASLPPSLLALVGASA